MSFVRRRSEREIKKESLQLQKHSSMARQENSFALLIDDESDDMSALIAAVAAKAPPPTEKKQQPQKNQQTPAPAKLPSKPLPPAESGIFLLKTHFFLLLDTCSIIRVGFFLSFWNLLLVLRY